MSVSIENRDTNLSNTNTFIFPTNGINTHTINTFVLNGCFYVSGSTKVNTNVDTQVKSIEEKGADCTVQQYATVKANPYLYLGSLSTLFDISKLDSKANGIVAVNPNIKEYSRLQLLFDPVIHACTQTKVNATSVKVEHTRAINLTSYSRTKVSAFKEDWYKYADNTVVKVAVNGAMVLPAGKALIEPICKCNVGDWWLQRGLPIYINTITKLTSKQRMLISSGINDIRLTSVVRVIGNILFGGKSTIKNIDKLTAEQCLVLFDGCVKLTQANRKCFYNAMR